MGSVSFFFPFPGILFFIFYFCFHILPGCLPPLICSLGTRFPPWVPRHIVTCGSHACLRTLPALSIRAWRLPACVRACVHGWGSSGNSDPSRRISKLYEAHPDHLETFFSPTYFSPNPKFLLPPPTVLSAELRIKRRDRLVSLLSPQVETKPSDATATVLRSIIAPRSTRTFLSASSRVPRPDYPLRAAGSRPTCKLTLYATVARYRQRACVDRTRLCRPSLLEAAMME